MQDRGDCPVSTAHSQASGGVSLIQGWIILHSQSLRKKFDTRKDKSKIWKGLHLNFFGTLPLILCPQERFL